MWDYILDLDRELVVWINGLNSHFLDNIMLFVSNKYSWIPVYLILIVYIFWRKKYTFKSASINNSLYLSIAIVLAIFLTFTLTDQISHSIIKPIVCRLRPSYDPYIQDLLRTPSGRGGLYGFVSSHASNFMGLATITALIFKNRVYTISALTLTALICYSRIYLGRHFLGDIIGGIILGIVSAYFVYYILNKIVNKRFNRQ